MAPKLVDQMFPPAAERKGNITNHHKQTILFKCKQLAMPCIQVYRGALMIRRSPCFPISSDPCVFDWLRAYAAFMVPAASASVIDIFIITQAKCITIG